MRITRRRPVARRRRALIRPGPASDASRSGATRARPDPPRAGVNATGRIRPGSAIVTGAGGTISNGNEPTGLALPAGSSAIAWSVPVAETRIGPSYTGDSAVGAADPSVQWIVAVGSAVSM